MMIFAADYSGITNKGEEKLCYIFNEIEEKCIESCNEELIIEHWFLNLNNNLKKKNFKVWNCISLIDINVSYWIQNYLLLNNVPPDFDRKIINYSYSTLIKIIKSNT